MSRRRAFVVEFEPVQGPRGALRGRVELVASGEVRHFRSARELVGFMAGILRRPADVGPHPTGPPADRGDTERRRRASLPSRRRHAEVS
jgi:hypothetical protein